MRKRLRAFVFIGVVLSSSLFTSPLDFLRSVWDSNSVFEPQPYRDKMAEKGLFLVPSYIQDLDWPTRGGVRSTSYPLYLFLFSLQAGIEFEKLIHLKGGNFYMNFLVHAGKNPSTDYVGDFQGFDNLEAYRLVQISELWYRQRFLQNMFTITVGKIDAFGAFYYLPYSKFLINNSYTQAPTIVGFPTYPDPAVGVILRADISSWLTFKFSVFDGSSAQGVRTGNLGAKLFFQNLGRHLLLLNECNVIWNLNQNRNIGEILIGLWGYNGQLSTFDNKTMGKACGPYICLNQCFWKQQPKQVQSQKSFLPAELGGFVQWGYVNQNIAGAKFYLGGGLAHQNIFKYFDSDALSLGVATVFFSSAPGSPYIKSYECALEATYQVTVLRGIVIQPDIQWIINPGGLGAANALVASLRLSISI